MAEKGLLEKIAACQSAAQRTTLTLPELIDGELDGTRIAILRLDGGDTLGLKISGGCISEAGGAKVAEIPSLDVLSSPEALLTHLQKTTGLKIKGIESFNS